MPISGAGVPVFTPTPMPTRANVFAEPATIFPAFASSFRPAGDISTTSNRSPSVIRRTSPPTVSLRRMTVVPVLNWNAGITATATLLMAPALSTVSSAA